MVPKKSIMVQKGSKSMMVHNSLKGSKGSNIVQNGPTWSKMLQNGPKVVQYDPKLSKIVLNGPNYSEIVQIIQNSQISYGNGKSWFKTV